MLSACYEALSGRRLDLLKAYLLAVSVEMLAVSLFLVAGARLPAEVPPFFGVATVLGGFLYGLGMVLALGCAGAMLYRAAEGKLDYLVAMAGFALGAALGARWLVAPLRQALHGAGAPRTAHEALGISPWPLALAPLALLALVAWRRPARREAYKGGWRWPWTGCLLGLTGAAMIVASVLTGHSIRPGAVQGTATLTNLLPGGDRRALDYGVFAALGMLGGSALASRRHGRSPGRVHTFERAPRSLAGGALMGLSAALVAGDNMLHGLGGVPLLALGSVAFIAAMVAGVWAGIRLGWLE